MRFHLSILGLLCQLPAAALHAQHADPDCPQQEVSPLAPAEEMDEHYPGWTRSIRIGGLNRALLLYSNGYSSDLVLRGAGGHILDMARVGAVDSSRFQPLVAPDSLFLLLFTHGGGGQATWDAVELVQVSACWLTAVWSVNTRLVEGGPDSLVARDSATVTFLDLRTIRVRGVRDQAVWEGGSAPRSLAGTRRAYEDTWAWDTTTSRFALHNTDVAH